MKSKQRLTAMLLAGCLAVSSVPVAFAADAPEQQQKQVSTLANQAREDSKSAAPTEGTCGENASWKLENGTLTISGTGEMADDIPWNDSRSSITKVVVEQGITSIGDYAFSYCRSLTSVTIPSSVTSIGSGAFYNCSSLSSVTIPNSVTSMGDYVFEDCSSLSSVTIPDSVTSMGDYVFENCSNLTSMTIPDSVTSIGYSTFKDCSGLSNVTIGSSVTSIGSAAFEGCSSLSSVTIPDSVMRIGNAAFYNCSGLSSVTIGSGVTSIENYTFYGCSSLIDITVSKQNKNYSSEDSVLFDKNKTKLVLYPSGKNGSYSIPDSVTSIGSAAFSGCSSLSSVTIPNSVTSIGETAFSGCSSLSSITIPNSVTSIGERVFSGCRSLRSVTIPDSVMSIGNSAFSSCSALTSVTIGSGVINIENSAFSGCSSLTDMTVSEQNKNYSSEDGVLFDKNKTEIVLYPSGKKGSYSIPDGVTSIGSSAFSGCSGLSSVTIPDSVTSIGSSAFSGCSSLSSVTIPDSVTSIGSSAFSGCSSLNSVTIPDSVTSIGDSAFKDCSSLNSVTIPDSVTSIGSSAFSGCSSLNSVTIPNSVTSIGSSAFSGCSSLSSVTIPNSVTSIGDSAFENCSSLSSVTIPDSVTSIKGNPFSGCSGLTDITVSEQNKNYSSEDGVLFNKDKTELVSYPSRKNKSYNIPTSVTSIGDSAFKKCSSLSSVTIPDGVTSIGSSAFSGCNSLSSVTIPDGVTSIESYAFFGCLELKNVIIPANTSVGYYAFGWYFYNSDGQTGWISTIDGFIAMVTEGSDGERYCKENGIKYETSHSFTNYVYNNDAQVGKDGTETAICDNGCGTTDTRVKKGTALPEPTTSVTELFCDVPSSAWYVDYVQFVYDNGLMKGTSETTFEPETTLSRAMVAQILYNRAGKPDVSGEAKFNDVPKDQWYYQAVQWAGEQGIVNGVGDGKFEPEADVTREQLAMMLYNAQGKPEVDSSLSGFEDTNTISDWAVNAVKWAVSEKIINGSKENGKLYINPTGNATRAEAATMFTRYDQEFD